MCGRHIPCFVPKMNKRLQTAIQVSFLYVFQTDEHHDVTFMLKHLEDVQNQLRTMSPKQLAVVPLDRVGDQVVNCVPLWIA